MPGIEVRSGRAGAAARGVTAGLRRLPGASPPGPAPGNDATPGCSGRGSGAPVPGCFTGHDDHSNPDHPETPTALNPARPQPDRPETPTTPTTPKPRLPP